MVFINEKQKIILRNYLLYFFTFFIVCLYGVTHANALSYTNIGELKNITQQLVSTYYGSAPFNNPINSGYAFEQVLEVDYIISNYNFDANKNYQLESNLPNQVFTNANYYSVQGLNGESCLISYPNSIMNNDHYPRWAFQCPHATNTITISIKNSSNEYLWSGSGIFNWSTALLKYSDTSLSSGSTNSDTIINNQNQNTQTIINNQNQNTQDMIDSQKVCTHIDKNNISFDNKFFGVDGVLYDNNYYGITNYIHIVSSEIKVLEPSNIASGLCFYDVNKSLIGNCILYNTLQNNQIINIPSNASFVRFTINKSLNKPQFQICQNGNQALNDSINNLDDTINDDNTSDAQNEASEFFSSFNTETFGLTSIITAPLNLIRSVIGEGSICTTLRLPLPYLDDKYLELPCMYSIYRDYFGDFFTIYQTITYGIVAYWVIVRIFNQVKDFKNPEHDEIEVMDL